MCAQWAQCDLPPRPQNHHYYWWWVSTFPISTLAFLSDSQGGKERWQTPLGGSEWPLKMQATTCHISNEFPLATGFFFSFFKEKERRRMHFGYNNAFRCTFPSNSCELMAKKWMIYQPSVVFAGGPWAKGMSFARPFCPVCWAFRAGLTFSLSLFSPPVWLSFFPFQANQ